jgi:hypothetical protein
LEGSEYSGELVPEGTKLAPKIIGIDLDAVIVYSTLTVKPGLASTGITRAESIVKFPLG